MNEYSARKAQILSALSATFFSVSSILSQGPSEPNDMVFEANDTLNEVE